jgi:membrane dipeptidase
LALLAAVAPRALADPDSIHERALVIDTHSDYLYRSDLTGDGLADEPKNAQTTLAKLRQGGMDAQFFSVWASPAYEKYG